LKPNEIVGACKGSNCNGKNSDWVAYPLKGSSNGRGYMGRSKCSEGEASLFLPQG